MSLYSLANWSLRGALAFALAYPGIDALVDPYAWIDYFPSFVRGVVPDTTLLWFYAAFEIVLALWVLSGKKVYIPAGISVLLLVAIVILNPQQFQLLFRDLSIALAALALALGAWGHERTAHPYTNPK